MTPNEFNESYESCFAYPEAKTYDSGCTILTEMLCKTKGKCNFFKTKEQYEKDKANYDFINSLKGVI